jgi:hypothetical protein
MPIGWERGTQSVIVGSDPTVVCGAVRENNPGTDGSRMPAALARDLRRVAHPNIHRPEQVFERHKLGLELDHE